MGMETNIIVLAILVLASAVFSGVEAALLSVSRLRIRTALRQKINGAEALARIKANPRRMMTTILIGNNILNVLASVLATVAATEAFGSSGVGIAAGVMTFLLLFVGEIIPKSIATVHAEAIAFSTAEAVELLEKILYPVAWLFEGLMRVMPKKYSQNTPARQLTSDEIRAIVDLGFEDNAINADEKRVITEVLNFRKLRAKDIMVPKEGVEMLSASDSISDAVRKTAEHTYSRYPVVSKDGRAIGIASINHIIKNVKKSKIVREAMDKALYASKERSAMELLKEMQEHGEHMAIVVDEFGELEGIITIQDLLEEFVGEFAGFRRALKKPKKGNIVIASGEARIEEIETALGREFSDSDSDSLSLFLHKYLQRIPREGDAIVLKGVKIEVRKMDGNMLMKATVKRLE